ncbi:MAG TPA: c-type cytochrome [Lysobacter sp.]|nr:c-type cytochrome [Lysobacter sp.]
MSNVVIHPALPGLLITLAAATSAGCGLSSEGQAQAAEHPANPALTPALIAEGQQIFRYDTFGDEQLWTDRLRMHEVVATIDPITALAVGLKVDSEALPPGILETADLTDPATTAALLSLDAVLGIKADVDADGRITRLGITCALCHSSVDDSVGPGIGRRMDGWANVDLDPGFIIALSPAVPPEAKAVYRSWGPGKYDPRFNIDGLNTPIVLPPAYGLRHIRNETFTGDGPVSYWNAYVAVTQMGGQGNFSDPRLDIDVRQTPDLVTPKLPALRAYQLSLEAPPPPVGSYDRVAARRGFPVFARNCMGCHVAATRTDNISGLLHAPEETGMDGAYAARTANKAYRTTPLRGLWQHPPYFHDGSAATLAEVVEHYDGTLALGLTADERENLVEYLKTL